MTQFTPARLAVILAVWVASPGSLAFAQAAASEQATPDPSSVDSRLEALSDRLRVLEGELGTEPFAPAAAGTPASDGDAGAALQAEIHQIDQKLRILERKLELEHEKETEAAKTVPVASAGREGFQVRSGDNAFQLRLRGLVQTDGRFYLEDSGVQAVDTLLLRRVRPIVEGTVFKYVDFRLTPDFGGGVTVLQDAYVDLRLRPSFRVRAGKQKQPFGLERLVSASAIPFVERALPTAVAANRDIGLVLNGDLLKNRVSYWTGVFNGVPDGASADVDDGDGKDIVGRVMVHPFRATTHQRFEEFGVGLAASYGTQHGALLTPGLPTYRSSGQQVFFRYRVDGTAAGTVIADGTRYRISAQGYLYSGRLGLLGEQVFSSQTVQRDTTTGRMGTNSWQLMGSWVLTGERASYNGVTPRYAFDSANGRLGAFELTARYHQLTADRDAFPIFANPLAAARTAKAWTGGVNWYLNRSVKVTTDYEQTRFDGGGVDGDRPTEHDVLVRIQLGF